MIRNLQSFHTLTVKTCISGILTYRYGPNSGDLHHGFGSGVEAAVLYGIADGDVSVQGDGAQVHDGGGGEQHVQVDPDRTQSAWERPGVVWRAERGKSYGKVRVESASSPVIRIILRSDYMYMS